MSSSPQSTLHTTTTTPVFIRDPNYSWLPANLLHTSSTTATVSITLPSDWHASTSSNSPHRPKVETRIVPLSDYPNRQLPLQNSEGGKSDLNDLEVLNEAAILYNLKDLITNGVVYTRVTDIVVATNPFQWIDGLYSKEKQEFFANRLIWNDTTSSSSDQSPSNYYSKTTLAPHVYETSSLAYRGLLLQNQNQAILVTGESGAGKTETVRIVLHHLSQLSYQTPTVEQVLQSNPLFEAFGNAKTKKNDNSSRFGKFLQLQFQPEDGRLSLDGCRCETYLLEKSRVVGRGEGERSYHVFYQLLSSPESIQREIWEGLSDVDCSSFAYLGEKEVCTDEYIDLEAWNTTVHALSLFGITGEKFRTLMRVLCATLSLGNIKFDTDPANDDVIASPVHETADVMGLSPDLLRMALTKRKTKTKFEEFYIGLSPETAKDNCDAFAKELYARVFHYLVRIINETTSCSSTEKYGVIGLLDIFGFELFDHNGFEQLCINYANERLQSKYVQDIFHRISKEYEAEGIQMFDLSMVDNTDVLHMLEGRMGLLSALNDECIRPKGNDVSFVYKLKANHRTSTHLISEKLHKPSEFGVRHFADKVKYDATNFVERNKDSLPQDLIDCACQSSNLLIRTEFTTLAQVLQLKKATRRRSSLASTTVTSKFKSQLNELMRTLKDSKTRYIRCIKPNAERKTRVMDHGMTLSQLKCAGLMTAITISRHTFPNRVLHEVVWERFRCLLPDLDQGEVRDRANRLCAKLLEGKHDEKFNIPPYACGKTKIFFRSGSLEFLETLRKNLFEKSSTRIQSLIRCVLATWKYGRLRIQIIGLQACWRRRIAIMRFLRVMRSCVRLQALFRSVSDRRKFRAMRKSIIRLQALWRGKVTKKRYQNQIVLLVRLQKSFRCMAARRNYQSKRNTGIVLQSLWRGKVARKTFRDAIVAVIVVQCWARCRLANEKLTQRRATKAEISIQSRNYHLKRNTSIVLQSLWRGKVARKTFRYAIAAVIVVQCWARCRLAKGELTQRRATKAAISIQSSVRKLKAKQSLAESRNAAITIQKAVRSRKRFENCQKQEVQYNGRMNECEVKTNQHKRKEEQAKMDQDLQHLQNELRYADTSGMNRTQRKAFKKSKKILGYLGNKTKTLRHKVSNLEENLTNEKRIAKEYKSQCEYYKASLGEISVEKEIAKTKRQNKSLQKVMRYLHRKRPASPSTPLQEVQSSHSRKVHKLLTELETKQQLHTEKVSKLRGIIEEERKTHEEEAKVMNERHEEDLLVLFESFQHYLYCSISCEGQRTTS